MFIKSIKKAQKTVIYLYCFVGALICICIGFMAKKIVEAPCVNIYDWYGVLPRSVLEDFEKETGIKINYDVFDNNEIVEAKLLARNSGYDVVFPTLIPYAVRQLGLGTYRKLDKKLLPNLKADFSNIDPFLMKQMKKIDSNLDYFLPYYWGTIGIAFDKEKLEQILPGIPKDGYDLLFDKENLKKLQPYGISLLQEAVDVFHPAMDYLNLEKEDHSLDDLLKTAKFLAEISIYIRRFSSSRFIMDLVAGEVCIAQVWSGEAIKAIEDAQKVGRHISYIIPKKGGEMWIDGIAIPDGAPHSKNAHAFINYLLRPEISARITNYSKMATMILGARPYIDKEVLNNPLIFPREEDKEKLSMSVSLLGVEGAFYNRVQDRIWTKLKVQREKVIPYIDGIARKLKKTYSRSAQ